jgi:WD40 repeat protein
LWDVETRQPIRSFDGHSAPVWAVAFSSDARLALSGSCAERDEHDDCVKGEMRVWDVATGETLHTLTSDERTLAAQAFYVMDVAFSPDDAYALSASCGEINVYGDCTRGQIILWSVETGGLRGTFNGHKDTVWAVAFSPDGTKVLSGSQDETARLWDVETREQLQLFGLHDATVMDVAFAPDGVRLLTSSADDTVRLWTTDPAEPVTILETLRGHEELVIAVAFSPDGQLAVSGSKDETLRLWDLQTGDAIATLTSGDDTVTDVAFSPDGTLVAAASLDQSIRLYAVP